MTRRIVLTGTPGTGKTTAASRLADEGATVIHLNDAIREQDLWTERDADRDSLVADLDAVGAWLDERVTAVPEDDPILVESHLAHEFDADCVVVLRCHPDVLADRLRERGESAASIAENRESEALGIVASEAVERHGVDIVHEIDTTDRSPEAVAQEIQAAIRGDRDPDVGHVDYLEHV